MAFVYTHSQIEINNLQTFPETFGSPRGMPASRLARLWYENREDKILPPMIIGKPVGKIMHGLLPTNSYILSSYLPIHEWLLPTTRSVFNVTVLS